jgi:DNA sulfur modification protein DndB
MIENVLGTEELRSLSRRKRRDREFRTLRTPAVPGQLAEGWQVERENRTSTRLSRPKSVQVLLRDRVWSLLYAMGFTHLSGEGGASLQLAPKRDDSVRKIDVVGLDPEIAVAATCRSAAAPTRDPGFEGFLAELSLIRERFANAANSRFRLDHKRVPVLAVFTSNLLLSGNDVDHAREHKVALLNEDDLRYYEQLASHLGPAAKYQLFSDMLPGRQIYGLRLAVPAIETKMGRHTCYSFSITPDYLLKIAYVSHRAKGQASDVDKYQRMIKKSRLKRIREYISENGVFPTNIVVSFEGQKSARFEKREQQGGVGAARYGTLHLTPSYGSAWIIDGQHRLFAYSGHERAKTSHLSVLAFQDLPASQQAQLFIDINHEQKSVKRSLLQELYAELNWDAAAEEQRLGAVVSKAVQALDSLKDSPLCGRIQLTDDSPTDLRCISLTSIFSALNQPEMFIIKKGVQYGPLWAGDNDRTLRRAVRVVKAWFEWIRDGSLGWWDLGKAEGGGLAMNDGVAVCFGALRAVFQHLHSKGLNLIALDDGELVSVLEPYGEALGTYLGSLPSDKRQAFRALRGNQGRTAARRRCEQALQEKFSDFSPPGLEEFLKLEAAQTNERGYAIIQRIETALQRIIIDALKAEYGDGQDETWWYNGIPQQIRVKAAQRAEEEQGKSKERYLDLIDFRTISVSHWDVFEELVAFGKSGSKEKRTEWMVRLNDKRKIVMHPAKQQVLTWDDLAELDQYDQWIQGRERCSDEPEADTSAG